MVTFVIVRHGYSRTNKEGKFTGQLDVPLDEIGVFQAKSTAEYILNSFKVDAVYSSDLSRAYETVRPIADAIGLTVNKSEKLREVDVGIWQGMLIEDVRREFPESFEAYKTNPGVFAFDGGESFPQFMKRVSCEFDEIANDNEGKTVVVGVHGGVIRALRTVWNNEPCENMKNIPHVPNASITVAEYGKQKIKWYQIGYTDHLAEKTTEKGIK